MSASPATKLTEEQLVAARRGKWALAGVPHKGWVCVDIEDLGSPTSRCEMCESQDIRYVHYMEHPAYAEVIGVGCVCAGHMEGDLAASKEREASMKSRASKRRRWLDRAWKRSQNGNPYIKADGHRVTLYRRGGGWAATVASLDGETVIHSRRNYRTSDEAALAAFDVITRRL
jgi:hypothetical protein